VTKLNFAGTSALLAPLYDDIVEAEEFGVQRPLLAHYTSLQTMEKMLKGNQIWLSNPLFMNDIEEFRFGMNEGLAVVENADSFEDFPNVLAFHDEIVHHYNHLYNTYAEKLAMDVYVMCLSEHQATDVDGQLSMWRGYGAAGNGACIVVDTSKFEPVEGTPFILGKIHYSSRSERIDRLKNYVLRFCEMLNKQEKETLDVWLCTYVLFERIKLFSIFTKHTGFREEAEWRLVYLSEQDTSSEFKGMIDYDLGRFGLEPKLKLDLARLPGIDPARDFFEQATDRIIVGPSLSSPHSLDLVKRMVEKCNHPNLKDRVVASQIPFRHRTAITGG
jgi:hypothetical protein